MNSKNVGITMQLNVHFLDKTSKIFRRRPGHFHWGGSTPQRTMLWSHSIASRSSCF